MRTEIRIFFFLIALLVFIYSVFPTRNHYWDGIGFALTIENSGSIKEVYHNPNHLMYNLTGYLVYQLVHRIEPGLRALTMLAAISTAASVATACLLFAMVFRWTLDRRLSVWVTLLMAFSATWWKFSTDANAYVPSVFLITLCTFLLTDSRRPPPVIAIGLVHGMSVLLHQIAVVFLPVVLVSLWYTRRTSGIRARLRSILAYTATAGGAVFAAYVAVWTFLLDRSWLSREFFAWLTFNSADTFSFTSAPSSIMTSLKTGVRVFFGGRASLALQFVEWPLLAVLLAVMAASLGIIVYQASQRIKRAIRFFRDPLWVEAVIAESNRFLLTWIAAFSLFLSFWLTEYPYYRLFYLPALLLLIAAVWRQRQTASTGSVQLPALRAFVTFMAAWNFAFLIYPMSKVEASPTLDLAQRAPAVWKDNAVVYYRDFTCDNWTLRYFNPRAHWRRVDPDRRDELAEDFSQAFGQGASVWIDTTLLDHASSSKGFRRWLNRRVDMSKPWGLSTSKHRIQFVELRLKQE